MEISRPTPTWAGAFSLIKSIGDWLLNLYHNGPKWMAWVAAGALVLVYFGFFSMPKVSAKDEGLEKQVAELTDTVKALKTSVDALKPAVVVKTAKKSSK